VAKDSDKDSDMAHEGPAEAGWHAEGARPAHEPSGEPGLPAVVVRRLGQADQAALAALLRTEPGFGLFLLGNEERFGLTAPFLRYWGLFRAGQLRGALMLIGRRAGLYAPPGEPVAELTQVAAREQVDFTMGRTDLVEAVLRTVGAGLTVHREEHYLAELPGFAGRTPPVDVPYDAVVRRAGLRDLEALTRLYDGSEGFEQSSTDEVRRSLMGRLHSMRTYVAEMRGRIVSAASTSAETGEAAMIGGVWTAPDARRRGYATAVVAALARELLAEGRRPYLFYRMENAAAARVYAWIGFRVVGRWTVAYLDQQQM
jgi:predicted GNAT family acetyltransferase